MGVSITAYHKLIKLEDNELEYYHEDDVGDGYPINATQAHTYPEFKQSQIGLIDGAWYSIDVPSFEIGTMPYGTYGEFRRLLVGAVTGSADIPETSIIRELYWEPHSDPSRYFFELINFSDAGGMISSIAMRELSKDFREGRSLFYKYLSKHHDVRYEIDFYMNIYDNFMIATNRCKNGFIEFS